MPHKITLANGVVVETDDALGSVLGFAALITVGMKKEVNKPIITEQPPPTHRPKAKPAEPPTARKTWIKPFAVEPIDAGWEKVSERSKIALRLLAAAWRSNDSSASTEILMHYFESKNPKALGGYIGAAERECAFFGTHFDHLVLRMTSTSPAYYMIERKRIEDFIQKNFGCPVNDVVSYLDEHQPQKAVAVA